MTATTPSSVTTIVQKVKALLLEADASATKYYAHLSSQGIAWTQIAQHDLNKWEAAATTLGTATLVGLAKRLQTWLKTTA